jgi:hypothetical protein
MYEQILYTDYSAKSPPALCMLPEVSNQELIAWEVTPWLLGFASALVIRTSTSRVGLAEVLRPLSPQRGAQPAGCIGE